MKRKRLMEVLQQHWRIVVIWFAVIFVIVLVISILKLKPESITIGWPPISVTFHIKQIPPSGEGLSNPPQENKIVTLPEAKVEIDKNYPRYLHPGEIARLDVKFQALPLGVDRLEASFENFKIAPPLVYKADPILNLSQGRCMISIKISPNARPCSGGHFIANILLYNQPFVFSQTADDVEIVPNLTILFPSDGVLVNGPTIVVGTVSALTPEYTLWMLEQFQSGLKYIHGPLYVAQDGTWSVMAFVTPPPLPSFGKETVEIEMYLADKDVAEVLATMKNQYIPCPSLGCMGGITIGESGGPARRYLEYLGEVSITFQK